MHDEMQLQHDQQTESTPSSRRRLLGASAGAFALTASGLLLPPGLVADAVREGANDGKLGGRHGKNRRGKDRSKARERKRERERGEADGAAAGGSLIRYVSCYAACQIATWHELQIDFYYRIKISGDAYSDLKFARTQGLGGVDTIAWYKPERYKIGAYIHASNLERACFVEMNNSLFLRPEAHLSLGGSISGGQYTGGTTQFNKGFSEDDIEQVTIGNATFPWGTKPVGISVRRMDDTDDYKVFQVYVTTG